MKKTLHFGKVDYNGEIEIEVELKDEAGKGLVLSICGSIWNQQHTDIIQGGQCLDTIAELLPASQKVQEIVEIWNRWHLNDMRAGSQIQEDFLRTNPMPESWLKNHSSHYEAATLYLQSVGLNPDPEGYQYGHAWNFEQLPQEVIDKVTSW